jgi:uncharacterized protein YjgD (DUF1641 family)
MAKEITEIPPPSAGGSPELAARAKDSGEDSLAHLVEILELFTRHQPSLVRALEVLDLLEEKGWLPALTYLLREWRAVYSNLSDFLARPGVERYLRNVTALGFYTLAELDPDEVKSAAVAINRGVRAAIAASRSDGKVGILDLASEMRDDNVNRGFRAVLGFLHGVGEGLARPPPQDGIGRREDGGAPGSSLGSAAGKIRGPIGR